MLKQSLMRSSLTAKERGEQTVSSHSLPRNTNVRGRDMESYGMGDNCRLLAQSTHANAL